MMMAINHIRYSDDTDLCIFTADYTEVFSSRLYSVPSVKGLQASASRSPLLEQITTIVIILECAVFYMSSLHLANSVMKMQKK